MAHKKEEPIPDDILAMSEEELRAERNSPDRSDHFVDLVVQREALQEAIIAHNQRNHDLVRALAEKLGAKLVSQRIAT